jgi:hypothetical protein
MMYCKNSSAVSDVCMLGGKLALDAGLFFATEGRVGEDHIHAFAVADLVEPAFQRVAIGNLRGLQAVQQQVHLRQHVGQGLGFLTIKGVALKGAALVWRFHLRADVVIGLNQEARPCHRPDPARFRPDAGPSPAP